MLMLMWRPTLTSMLILWLINVYAFKVRYCRGVKEEYANNNGSSSATVLEITLLHINAEM